ncbi:hypothetical protein GY45DRAFT_1299916 [Cubamyces sp. BRFM 1775]|nr:hypothetical protein GY45DRAFT_1299916 [Cubamyces sp. BRFM 1775]
MSFPLLRQATIPQSLAAARRIASRCRCYSAVAAAHAQSRQEPESHDATPVAGPSSRQQDAVTANNTKSQPALTGLNDEKEDPEPFSRVQSYLASINASGAEPTLEDLEQCRPSKQPQPHSPRYVQAYTELIATLCRSFTKEQLRKFLVQTLGTSRHCATNRKKAEYAESILEKLWGWPTLKELEKAKRDRTEVLTKVLPVTASELFLILGKDGSDLLRLSKEYDVHISLRRKPMGLRVEGTRGSLRGLAEHIDALKKSFVQETYTLPIPAPIPPSLVQRISRLSGAYLENDPQSPGQLRLVAKGEHGLMAAKRLASRAVQELEESARIPLLTYLPPGESALAIYPHSYALYPYLSPRSLPFTMHTGGSFRIRRVGEWLQLDSREDVRRTGGLAGSDAHITTVDEQPTDLHEVLLGDLHKASQFEGANVVLKASTGHMLLNRQSGEQKSTLIPPLTGEHSFGKVRKWMAQNPVKMTFVPDLPLPLLSLQPDRQSVKHRLVYHALPAGTHKSSTEPTSLPSLPIQWKKVISLELTLTDLRADECKQPARTHLPERDLEEGLTLEDLEEEALPLSSSSEESSIPILKASGARCWAGAEADLNLLIPDRPMDLQFTVRNAATLSETQQPPELQEYVAKLRAYLQGSEGTPDQPRPPLLLEYAGERYILHSNSSIKQSEEKLSDTGRPSLREIQYDRVELTRAVCESVLDLETSQKSMHCEVFCDNIASEDAWKRFLRDCDRLSAMQDASRDTTSALLDGDDIF